MKPMQRWVLVVSCALAAGGVVYAADTTPPTVESVSPSDGASQSSKPNPIVVTFDEVVDDTTVNTGTMTLLGSGGDGTFDDALTGVIASPEFTVEEAGYVALVSGGRDPERLYVALVEADTGKEVARLTGHDDNAFDKIRIDCSDLKGKKAFIRVVDQAQGPWGHINFGGIYKDPLEECES